MNIATSSMEKMTAMLRATDKKLKEFADEPYGTVKLTAAQQRERIKKMTPEQLQNLINRYGPDSVNEWLRRYWEEQ
jgi:hypothetical protein